jgi:hypothetical protein
MKKVTKSIFGGIFLASVFAMVAVFSPIAPTASAVEEPEAASTEDAPTKDDCKTEQGIRGGIGCTDTGTPDKLFGDGSIFTTIVNVLLFLIGAISVIMLIVGGIRYTISNGDSGAVTSAKNTILYAIVGLIIAFLAFAIVNWVLGAITPTTSG